MTGSKVSSNRRSWCSPPRTSRFLSAEEPGPTYMSRSVPLRATRLRTRAAETAKGCCAGIGRCRSWSASRCFSAWRTARRAGGDTSRLTAWSAKAPSTRRLRRSGSERAGARSPARTAGALRTGCARRFRSWDSSLAPVIPNRRCWPSWTRWSPAMTRRRWRRSPARRWSAQIRC